MLVVGAPLFAIPLDSAEAICHLSSPSSCLSRLFEEGFLGGDLGQDLEEILPVCTCHMWYDLSICMHAMTMHQTCALELIYMSCGEEYLVVVNESHAHKKECLRAWRLASRKRSRITGLSLTNLAGALREPGPVG